MCNIFQTLDIKPRKGNFLINCERGCIGFGLHAHRVVCPGSKEVYIARWWNLLNQSEYWRPL